MRSSDTHATPSGAMTEDARPRVARGSGTMPLHVEYIFLDPSGRYRIQFFEPELWRSRLGLRRSLHCANAGKFDRQMQRLIAAHVPFMIGRMIPGPADDAWFWLQAKGREIAYLEIAVVGPSEWCVREMRADAMEWREVSLAEILGPPFDPFRRE